MPTQEKPLAGAATTVSRVIADLFEQVGRSDTLLGLIDRLGQCVATPPTDSSPRPASTRLQVAGLAGSALALVVGHVYRNLNHPMLVVAGDQHRGEALRDDLEAILGPEAVLHLPDFESLPYDLRSPHLSILDSRLTALSRLALGTHAVVVTTARALATRVPSPKVWRSGVMTLQIGDPMDADELADWLAGLAYQGVPLAEEHGDFARRGGILDVFSFGYANPLRLEFDGDEVVSIREYDPATQRSVCHHQQAVLVPRREMVIDDPVAEQAAARLRQAAAANAQDAETLALRIENERYFIGMRRIAGYIEQDWGSVFRYLAADTLVVCEASDRLRARIDELGGELNRMYVDRRVHHELASPPEDLVLPSREIEREVLRYAGFNVDPVLRSTVRRASGLDSALTADLPRELREELRDVLPDTGRKRPESALDDLDDDVAEAILSGTGAAGEAAATSDTGDAGATDAATTGATTAPGAAAAAAGPLIRFHTSAQEPFGRSIDLLRGFLRAQLSVNNRTVILCDNPGQRDRLRELISGGDEEDGGGPAPMELAAEVELGQLSGGFVWREVRLAVLTDHEIFARFRRRRTRRRFKAGISLPSLASLKLGEYVVHIDHGIGIYRGTQRLTIGGHETDCLEVHYQRGDKLFIPVDQFDLIQKYSMEEGQRSPSISRLGGTAWARTKAKARKAIQDMTDELLRMHALRNERAGFAFEPDTVWQRQLEASFLYDDTPDQAKATEDIKRDMETTKPMDRLICGDVGFGKTEVAVRAAFKAVQSGKQVAVLVPTTILASQHLATFTERLAGFAVRVEMLSRFRTAAEQRDVVAKLKTGEVDVVIGTHRLVQKDVEMKDLGLIVIDEEQRFGVRAKEKLKQLKAVADVLTLTATPIPRTLHLALLGTRDISLITTPPRDRVPVATEIVEFDRDLIADSLLREVDRGGQAFFVHNRVQSIDAIARFLTRICPQLRFGVAHGQMRERQLEKMIVDFVDRKYDVLITTMIIESGIDMPSVNTMLVNRADRFGLAQLYQLRGRVGRSDQRASCYLMVPPHRALTETAEKRLRAVEEYDELGAGIKIAMKDLEIRGAGNILGAEQHGHIAAVGYDMYCRLLEEAVSELRGQETETIDTKVTTDLDAYLADDYVAASEEKILFYKRLADTTDGEQIDELFDELTDRYGRPGEAARNLFELRRVKLRAAERGISEVDVGASRVRFVFAAPPTPRFIKALLDRTARKIEFVQGEKFAMRVVDVGDDPPGAAHEVLDVIEGAKKAVGGDDH